MFRIYDEDRLSARHRKQMLLVFAAGLLFGLWWAQAPIASAIAAPQAAPPQTAQADSACNAKRARFRLACELAVVPD